MTSPADDYTHLDDHQHDYKAAQLVITDFNLLIIKSNYRT